MAKVKASPTDMKWMAIGEVGALLLSISAGVWFMLAVDVESIALRLVCALVVVSIAAKATLGFVHLGYVPSKDGSKG